MNTKLTEYLSLLKYALLIPSLLVVLTACSTTEDNKEIENMQKEIDELKSSLDKKEETQKSQTKNEQNESEEVKKEEKIDQSSELGTNTHHEEPTLNQEETGSLDIDKSNLTLVTNTIFNTHPDSVIKLYQDNSGNEYFEETYNGVSKIYHKEMYYVSPEVWEPFIQGYDQAVEDFYNGKIPERYQNYTSTGLSFMELTETYVTDELLQEFVEKKSTSNFDNHSSSIEFISAQKYNDQDVIITAMRKYSHASGSGHVTNRYYVNILNKKVTFYEPVN